MKWPSDLPMQSSDNRLQRMIRKRSIAGNCNTYTEPIMRSLIRYPYTRNVNGTMPVQDFAFTALVEACGNDEKEATRRVEVIANRYNQWFEETAHYSIALERTNEGHTRVLLFTTLNNGLTTVWDIAEFQSPEDNKQLAEWIRDWVYDDHHLMDDAVRLKFNGNDLEVSDPVTTGIFLMSQKVE